MISGPLAQRWAVRAWITQRGGRILVGVKLAVAVILIGILVGLVDWRQSLQLLGQVEPLPALCAAVLLAVGVALSTLKWRVLLAAHGIVQPLMRLLRYYWIGAFFSNFLPSNVGGDVVRLSLMYKQGSLTIVGASIFVERLTGLFVLLCLAAFGLVVLSEHFAKASVLVPMWLLVLTMTGILGAAVVLGSRAGGWVRTPLERDGLLNRLMLVLIETTRALAYYQQRPKAILSAVLLSVFFYFSMVFFQYSVILSIGGDVALIDVALIAPLVALVSFVPISINALGLAEGAFVLFFVQAGLSPEEALAAAVLRRVMMTAYSMIGGVIWLREKPRFRSAT